MRDVVLHQLCTGVAEAKQAGGHCGGTSMPTGTPPMEAHGAVCPWEGEEMDRGPLCSKHSRHTHGAASGLCRAKAAWAGHTFRFLPSRKEG